jgi:hypothetical protein
MSSPEREHRTAGPASVAVAPNVWIRNTRRTRIGATVAVALSLGFAGIFFVPGNPHWQKTAADQLGLGVFFFGTAALGLAFARRLSAAALWMGPDGIVVRGRLKTRRIPLAEAEAFVPGVLAGAGNGTPCPMLKLKHGGAVGVWALGREGVAFRYRRYVQELQPLCDELTEVLKALQSGATTRGPEPDSH